VDSQRLELCSQSIPRRSHSVVRIVDDDLPSLLLEEIQSLLFETFLDL